MPSKSRPRRGSLQFWPRKRVKNIIPSVNWKPIESKTEQEGLLGFIAYKAGMISIQAEDQTPNSLMLNQQVILPATILECHNMKLFAIRFYENNKVLKDVLVSIDKDLKRKVKIPKSINIKKLDEVDLEKVTDIRVVLYTQPKLPKLKKKPDIVEIGIKASNIKKKLEIAKSFLDKEISLSDIFKLPGLIDLRGTTKGKGFQGPVKRFGIALRQHKSEKGVRRVGSIGPWTPSKVTFRTPVAGQQGFFNRAQYNNVILKLGNAEEASKIIPKGGFKNYGIIRNSFIVIKGSLQGPQKRALLITHPLRTRSKIEKYEIK